MKINPCMDSKIHVGTDRVHLGTPICKVYKSVNLQYITLGCLDDGTIESATKRLMIQVLFFFIKSCKIILQKPFQFIFLFFLYKFKRIRLKSFECPKSIRNYEKK